MFTEASLLYVVEKCATKMLYCRPDMFCKARKCYSQNLAQSVSLISHTVPDGSILHFLFVSCFVVWLDTKFCGMINVPVL